MSRFDASFSNGREEDKSARLSRKASSPIAIRSPASQRQTPHPPRASPSSSTASESYSDDDVLSRVSSSSTAHSSAPSLSGPPAMNLRDHGYEFPCEFGFIDCHLSFHPTQLDSWISHSASHFVGRDPPPKTCCTFCDRVFEIVGNPNSSWRKRMLHIADHLRHEGVENMRPDFFIIEYMKKKRLISAEDYKWAIGGTERPVCDGLVDLGHKLPEVQRKEDRRREERHDLQKEDRQRRREKDSRGKGGGKGIK